MSMESGSHPRLRTAYDRKAMAGEVPWVPGGNPTPEEAARQEAYDADRPTVDLSRNPDPSEYADQVPTGEGGVISRALASRGEAGWEADADRDSAMAAALAEHVKALDVLAERFTRGELSDEFTAVQAVRLWQAIRKITRSEGGR